MAHSKKVLSVSEADLLERITQIQGLIRELLLPQQHLVAPLDTRIQAFLTQVYEAIATGQLLDPPDAGDPVERRWLDWLRDQLSQITVTLSLAAEQSDMLAIELLQMLRDNPDADMARREVLGSLIWQHLETVLQAIRPREEALLPAVQSELANLSVLLQKVGKLVAKTGGNLFPRAGLARRRELLFLLESLELAVVALRGEQPDLQVASQLRIDIERLINRNEFFLWGWFLNRGMDLYRSPSVPLKVVTGLSASFLVSASLIFGSMWLALKPTPLEEEVQAQERLVSELRNQLLSQPGLNLLEDGTITLSDAEEPPIPTLPPIPTPSPVPSPLAAVGGVPGSRLAVFSGEASSTATLSSSELEGAIASGTGLSLGEFVGKIDEYNNRLRTRNILRQELDRERKSRQDDDALYILIILVAGSGMMGSVVSILIRISDFDSDFDSTRGYAVTPPPSNRKSELDPLLPIFIGAFKPIIGVSFGLLAFALFSAGIVSIEFKSGGIRDKQFFFSAIAFTIGFSERLAKDVIRRAEGLIGSGNS